MWQHNQIPLTCYVNLNKHQLMDEAARKYGHEAVPAQVDRYLATKHWFKHGD